LLISLGLFIFSKNIIIYFAGNKFLPAVKILRVLSLLPIIISVSNIICMQILIPMNKKKAINKILGFCGFLSLVLVAPFIYYMGAFGAAINAVIIESFVSLFSFLYLLNTGLIRKFIK
jgi:O-antigen flippase